MYKVGYTTGTFDLPHYGHFSLLEKCKSYCDKLIVGLVSDELGVKQKRKPILSYEHRKCILENSKWVDHVVVFDGTSKQIDYQKMKFDVLFISDEYFGADEYSHFKDTPVYYFPRTINVSTSDVFKDIVKRVIDETSLYNSGTGSDIIKFKYKNDKAYVIKSINIALKEENTTANVFNMSIPPPRNWKLIGEQEKDLPFLSGINPNREIEICKFLMNKPWFLVENIVIKTKHIDRIMTDTDHINEHRKHANTIVWLVQKDGGITLDKFFVEQKANLQTREYYYNTVRHVIEQMRSLGILHMDLHAQNIVVKDNQISIIDFGWCLHRSFIMEKDERGYYETYLDLNFDLTHFRESLVVMGIEKEIPSCLL